MSEGNGYVTKDELFAQEFQRTYDDYTGPFCGMTRKFRLQNLHDGEKGEFDAASVNSKGKFNRNSIKTANARIVSLCCVDGEGKRLFKASDVDRLMTYDSGEMEKLASACRKHCGWDEEPEKNSDTTDGDGSPTS